MNQVTSASLRYPLSVFNKNSTFKHTGTQHAVTHTCALTHTHTGTHVHGAGGGGEGARKRADLSTCLRVCICHVYLCVHENCILGVRTSAYVQVSFFLSFYLCMCVFMVFFRFCKGAGTVEGTVAQWHLVWLPC